MGQRPRCGQRRALSRSRNSVQSALVSAAARTELVSVRFQPNHARHLKRTAPPVDRRPLVQTCPLVNELIRIHCGRTEHQPDLATEDSRNPVVFKKVVAGKILE